MRRVREILRLKDECGASARAIAVAVGVARSAVQLCLAWIAMAGLSWPLPPALTDAGLEAVLFAPIGGSRPGARHKAEPDWAAIHRELRRVLLQNL
jgi:transposase